MCTVGYGDLPPTTTKERIFVTFCMLMSAGIYASTLENVEKLLKKHDVLAEEYRNNMLYVN